MSKSLDALQRLYDHNYGNDFYIKAEEDAETIEKELKALEIIKREPFAFASLAIFLNSFDSYEEWEKTNPNCFTREEYELLKEVLK